MYTARRRTQGNRRSDNNSGTRTEEPWKWGKPIRRPWKVYADIRIRIGHTVGGAIQEDAKKRIILCDSVRETCETERGMKKRSENSLRGKWRTLSKKWQPCLSCCKTVRKRSIIQKIENDAMEKYTETLYGSRSTRTKIAERFQYHEPANCLSKYPKFAEMAEMAYRLAVSRQTNTDTVT